jgi:chemotaxis protein CheX
MILTQPMVDSVSQNLSMFGFAPEFNGTSDIHGNDISLGDVHVLFGLTDGLHGSIVLGFKMPTALNIVSFMMGGMTIESLDEMSQSALGELGNMIVGTGITNANSPTLINFSTPTILVDGHIYVNSKETTTTKIQFQLNGEPFYISITLENE